MRVSTLLILALAAIVAVVMTYWPQLYPAGPGFANVDYSDLNLATRGGAGVMLQRLERAAGRVCTPPANISDRAAYGAWRSCVSASVRLAVTTLNAPMVTAAYSGKPTGQMVLAASR
jgi:UrcA family protein